MQEMLVGLNQILPKVRILSRAIDRYAFASDASHFYLVPKVVVQPIDILEVQNLMLFAAANNLSLTFRAGGTSLSGQSVTDSILVDLSRFWKKISVENNGELVRVQPAVIGAHVNRALKGYGKKIGPDPASITAAMMGGILSNNSSGMCCGVKDNAYHTIKYLTFILPNGHVYNTQNALDYKRFEIDDAALHNGLTALRQQILNQTKLSERIKKKYLQKNTTGYSLNAFLDFEHPLDIFAHLLIGAEGTLAFIADAVLQTIPDFAHKKTGMLYFETIDSACSTIEKLVQLDAKAIEFMDRAALCSVENEKGIPKFVKALPKTACALLVEFQSDSIESLELIWREAEKSIDAFQLLHPAIFTEIYEEQAQLWKIRKGMYPSVASIRASGTSVMLEDLTFPVARLNEAIADVQNLLGWQPDQISGLEIFVDNIDDSKTIKNYIYNEIISAELSAQTVREEQPGIFDWLDLQNVNERVIIILMLTICIINMITAILIFILERTNMVGILKSLGARNAHIQQIFFFYGAIIIVVGITLGNLLGVGLGLLQHYFKFIKLNESDYYLSYAPIYFDVPYLIQINFLAIIVILLFITLPTYLITRITPVETIRFR